MILTHSGLLEFWAGEILYPESITMKARSTPPAIIEAPASHKILRGLNIRTSTFNSPPLSY